MNLHKFKEESKRKNLPETTLYVLKKFQQMFDTLSSLLELRTRHFIKYSGTHTTVAGSTTQEIDVTGTKASMRCNVSVHTLGASRTHVIAHRCEKGKIVVEMGVDPGSDHILEYTIST